MVRGVFVFNIYSTRSDKYKKDSPPTEPVDLFTVNADGTGRSKPHMSDLWRHGGAAVFTIVLSLQFPLTVQS